MERMKKAVTATEEDKVWVSCETTVNLGNYENLKLGAGISHTLLPGEDPFAVRYELMSRLREELMEDADNASEENTVSRRKARRL